VKFVPGRCRRCWRGAEAHHDEEYGVAATRSKLAWMVVETSANGKCEYLESRRGGEV
jgi:hypothetical protein